MHFNCCLLLEANVLLSSHQGEQRNETKHRFISGLIVMDTRVSVMSLRASRWRSPNVPIPKRPSHVFGKLYKLEKELITFLICHSGIKVVSGLEPDANQIRFNFSKKKNNLVLP